MHTAPTDEQVLGDSVTWNTRPSVINGFWISTPTRVGSNLVGGTRTMVTNDFGDLVRIDFRALAASVAN
jgi:hypothetical protein